MPSTSIIVPTYNRSEDLKDFIESLLKQTVLPDELIIVDDGNLSEIPLKGECLNAGILPVYFKKDTPGLTASRNEGIKLAKGDIVFFFDDDIVLSPQYIEKVLKVYSDDKDGVIGGVSGRDMNLSPMKFKKRLRRLLDIIFLISGLSEGKVLPSGFCTEYGVVGNKPLERSEVDFLSGCSFSFRKEVFNHFLFDTKWFLNYGMGEDKDFSYRVSRKYKLVYEPSAELLHNHSPLMRPNHEKTGRMFVLFMHTFHTRYGKKGIVGKLLYYYALTGYMLIKVIIVALTRKKHVYQYLKGMFMAIGEIMRNGNVVIKE
jgi:glycosyltransferase involved in cell wall biosynthesis